MSRTASRSQSAHRNRRITAGDVSGRFRKCLTIGAVPARRPGQVLPSPPTRPRPRAPARDPRLHVIRLQRPTRNIDIRHTPHNEPIIDTYRPRVPVQLQCS